MGKEKSSPFEKSDTSGSAGKTEGRKRETKPLEVSFVAQKFATRSKVTTAFEIPRDEAGNKNECRGMTEGLQFNV